MLMLAPPFGFGENKALKIFGAVSCVIFFIFLWSAVFQFAAPCGPTGTMGSTGVLVREVKKK